MPQRNRGMYFWRWAGEADWSNDGYHRNRSRRLAGADRRSQQGVGALLRRARRRAGERLRAPCHGWAGVDGARIGFGGGSHRRPRSAAAAPRPVPALPTDRPVTEPITCFPPSSARRSPCHCIGGRVALGTWQSLVLVDLNVDNPRRRVRFSFLPASPPIACRAALVTPRRAGRLLRSTPVVRRR